MIRKKKGEGTSRRARLDIFGGEDSEDSISDPVAAALAEREKKKEEALRSAAAAAARNAAANLITFFADDSSSGPPPARPTEPPSFSGRSGTAASLPGNHVATGPPAQNGLVEDANGAAQGTTVLSGHTAEDAADEESTDEGSNALASLLGYSADDGSGSEAGEDEAAGKSPERQRENAPSEDGDSNMDAELANFMEELESSGLLKEEASGEEPSPPAEDEQEQPAASAEPEQQPPNSQPAAETAEPPGPSLAETGRLDVDEAGQRDADGGSGGEYGVAEADGSGEAEQRVLGALEGCPGWHEVMDMASGRVYFWNEDSDEVAWDPPEGAVPRSKLHNEAVFAASRVEQQSREERAELPHEEQAQLPQAQDRPKDDNMQEEEGITETGEDATAVVQLGEVRGAFRSAAEGQPGARTVTVEGKPYSGSDQEEGQLQDEDRGTDAGPDAPAEEVGAAGEALLARAWEAAGRLCGPAPLLVQLAVEAEVRLRDWKALSQRQQEAAALRRQDLSLSWTAYQQSVQDSLRRLEEAFPMALEEAQQASAAAAAAVTNAAATAAGPAEEEREEGEVPEEEDALPPLPTELPVPAKPPLPAEPPLPTEPPLPSVHADMDMDMDMDMDIDKEAPQPSTPPAEASGKDKAAAAAPGPSAQAEGPAVSTAPPVQSSAAIGSQAQASRPAAVAMRPAMVAPLPVPAPQWPGYYHQFAAFPYPFYRPMFLGHIPTYHPFAQQAVVAAAAAQPASVAAVQVQPPLPADDGSAAAAVASHLDTEQPPIPSDDPDALLPGSAGPDARAKEYRAEPVRVASPVGHVAHAGAAEADMGLAAAAVAATEEDRKRKRERPGAPTKKKKALKVGKATSSLIDKWAAVRKDLEEEDEEEEAPDAEALERKRMREAEEWRLKQLKAGISSEDNSNFQPLALDWREKIKVASKGAKKKGSAAAAAATQAAAPMRYSKQPDLEALSEGLPTGWKAMWDKVSGEVFYGNPSTKETSWEKPT